MSAKRRATTDLNHDNWNEDDEVEDDAGTFKRASNEELAKRTIKTARRRAKPFETDESLEPSKSVFSSFGGFVKDSSTIKSSPFAFLSTTKSTTNGGKVDTIKSDHSDDVDSVQKDQMSYYAKLKGLNNSITDWIQTKVKENPFCILTPIFDDYDKHLKTIQESHKSSDENTTPPSTTSINPTTASTGSTFTFSSLASSKPSTSSISSTSTTSSASSTSLASTKSNTDSESKPLFSFGSQSNKEASTATAPKFSFGNLGSSTGFSFGGPGAKPFTFNNVSKPVDSGQSSDTTDKTDKTDKTEENDDDDQPPKYEFVPVVEKDNFYSKRCKIFVKADKEYADRGVGMLYLKKVEGSEKTQLLVRADTSLGNILLNILLSEAVPAQRLGKNNVMMVCLPTPDAQTPTSVLIRVKNEEEANALLAEIDKHRK